MKYCFIKKVIFLFFIISGLCLSLFTPEFVFAEPSGEELYRQGKYKEAYNAFTKADMDRPKDIYNRYNRGCAAVRIKDNKAAAAAFTSVLNRAADDSDIRFKTFYNRGITAFKQGDMNMAVDDFKSALKLNPLDKDALFNFELALLQKKISEQKKHDQEKDKKDDSSKDKGKDKKDKKDKKPEQKDSENSQKNKKNQDNKQTDNTDNKKGQKDKESSRQGEKQDRNKDKDTDLSGSLSGSDQKNQPKPDAPLPGKLQMDRNRAKALLDNVHDDPSAAMKAMKTEEKQVSSSGKKW